MDVYLLDEKDEITNPIQTYNDIGPEFKFNLKVIFTFFTILTIRLRVNCTEVNELFY